MAETRLEISQPGQPDRQLVLHAGCYRLGRDSAAEVVLAHGAVSRRHALLEQVGTHWLLQDDGSTNGLWWQGRRIRQLLLRDGDRVRFGPDDQEDLPEIRFRRSGGSHTRCLLKGASLGLAAAAAGGLLLLLVGAVQQPIRSQLSALRGPLLLFDRNGQPIASANDQSRRELPSLSGFSPVLVSALLASEDSRFWWHPGVDPIGTSRALLANLVGGRVREGGSTLTQQLARSLYPEQVGQGETLGRKWRELLVALQLEARFSKSDLLLSYLNNVYLGAGWGFEEASRRLFGKPAAALQLEEAALLVGLLPSPNSYDPCFDPQAALEARNQVLAKMEATGRLSSDQARSARRQPIQLAPTACRPSKRKALPYYSDQVRRDLERTVGPDVASEGNFLLDTHLDPNLQELVERLLRQHIDSSRSLGVSQGAVVVLDSRNNGILALAGGRDYRQSQFNRATMALRQPGSTFKLITYLLALEQGAKPSDPIRCDGLDWMGQHFASGCGGSLSLRQALAISSNTAALRLARRVGLEAIVRKARELGITTPLNPVPGLALGQSEVTLLELTAAYGAVASDGIWRAPSTIRRLTDAETCRGGDGRCQQRSQGRTPLAPGRRVMKPATARTLQQMLGGVVHGGTGSAASLGGSEWGKTGTTNDGRDLLFIGVEPKRHWVIGIWLGNDDNSPTQASSALAASLWAEIVRASSPSAPAS